MHCAVDVQYAGRHAVAAGILFADFRSDDTVGSKIVRTAIRAPYESGSFFRRELPPLLALVKDFELGALDSIVIDGYVWLGRNRPGLGAFLFEALGKEVPIVGVAKRSFAGNDAAVPVVRGTSQRPLYISSIGLDITTAAENIRTMAGPFRIPTLLRAVDRLARSLPDG